MAGKLKQFRNPDMSQWQSAVDEMVAKSQAQGRALDVNSPAPVSRPDPGDPMIAGAAALEDSLTVVTSSAVAGQPGPAEGIVDTAAFCSTTAFKLAKAKLEGNTAEAARLYQELTVPLGPCDPKWLDVVGIYLANRASGSNIPYRKYNQLSDYVISGVLQNNARVALVADWGVGDDAAKLLLRQIAEKDPDVVIHLGDVYYSGTAFEYQNYFYKIWQPTLGLPPVSWGSKPVKSARPATFTLPGNHDMYSGGQPYYTIIDMLGQPASYFCLRNDNWQFIAMDTGLHDCDPVFQKPTYLEDAEVTWVKDKIGTAGGRKTILLSHHQLFTTFEKIGSDHVNQNLLTQLGDILPQVAMWFWGHEHNLVIYNKYKGVLGRCIGHGGFPVDVDFAKATPDPDVAASSIALEKESGGAEFQHGYVILDIAGASATVTYYEFDSGSQEETVVYTESIGGSVTASPGAPA